MKADANTTAEIQAAIKTFTDAYESRNLDSLMASVAPDADVVLYGTGADERRVGPNEFRIQVERDWAQTEHLSLAWNWSSVSAAGSVAWAALEGNFKIRAGGHDIDLPARVSLVFEKRGQRWLLVHAHFSTPAAGQAEGSSF